MLIFYSLLGRDKFTYLLIFMKFCDSRFAVFK